MKHRAKRAVLAGMPILAGAVLLGLAASTVQAATLAGTWQEKGSPTVLRFEPCGPATCGVLVSSHRIQADPDARDIYNKNEALRSRRIKGLSLLTDLKPVGQAWKGRVYLPSRGASYDVTVKLIDAETLDATGCAAPFLCDTMHLVRKP